MNCTEDPFEVPNDDKGMYDWTGSIGPGVSVNKSYGDIVRYGSTGFEISKLERCLPKNQHTQRKILNFENWVNGEVSKSTKSPNLLTLKVKFWHFLRPCHYSNSQNSKISFEYVDS